MELEKLIQERDAYAGKILQLGIIIAVIFLLPAIIAIVVSRIFDIQILYLLMGAFVISWVGVIILYRRVHRKVQQLESKIRELQREQQNTL